MNPQETQQLAAARTLAATLHNVLEEVLESPDGGTPEVRERAFAALAHNEPTILAVLADAASAAKFRALKIRAEDVVAIYNHQGSDDPPAEAKAMGEAITALEETLRTLP